MTCTPPLAELRVVDLTSGPSRYVGRLLAEFGAEAVFPCQPGQVKSTCDTLHDLGKILLPEARSIDDFRSYIANADLLILNRDNCPDEATARDLEGRYPHLVILIISEFGLGNGLSDWSAGEAVYQALGGQLSRSGIPGRKPLLAPGSIATHSALTQATFLALLAFFEQQKSGRGQIIDFSMVEGSAQALDPGFGIQGSATSGIPASKLPRGRPEARFQYPILKCRDGFARICVLSPRQWQGMFRWLGEPEEFSDPSFASLIVRYRSPDLIPAIARLFADKTRAEIEEEATNFGVPAAGLATLEEAIENEHFTARGTLKTETLPDGKTVRRVSPTIEFDGRRDYPTNAGEHLGWSTRKMADPELAPATDDTPPLEGIRVLDLGVIVVGAEAGRLFADFGADVIKVESPLFPDGARQTKKGDLISPGFAAGHRNKRSLALDLRNSEGRKQLLSLVRKSDVVFSNFKPGTMESLGLGPDQLLEENPRIILVESSAFGAHGPWANRGGYGPLVRAAAGLTYLWRYSDDPLGFSDALTVYPDHAAGRMSAIAAIALLLRRNRTNRGGHATIAQAEVMLSHLEQLILDIDMRSVSGPLQFVNQCAGEDEWCVVEIGTDDERSALCETLDIRDTAPLSDIETALSDYCSSRAPLDVARALQGKGVAAAPMLRVPEMGGFPFFRDRNFLQPLSHPFLEEDYQMECAPVSMSRMNRPPTHPAPLMGEHTRQIASSLLGLSDDEIERLIAEKVLFEQQKAEA